MSKPKVYTAPKVWRRPYTTIYNDNYRYGTSLYSEAISDLESKDLLPLTSTRAHPVFYYSTDYNTTNLPTRYRLRSHSSPPPTHRSQLSPRTRGIHRDPHYGPLAARLTRVPYETFQFDPNICNPERPLSYHYYIPELDAPPPRGAAGDSDDYIIDFAHVGTSPASALAMDSIAASREAASRRAEAAIAAAEATLHSSELSINRSRAIEAMEHAMNDASMHRLTTAGSYHSGASSLSPPRPRPAPLQRLSSPMRTGAEEYASDLGIDLRGGAPGTPMHAQNRWYTNSVRSVRPDVYIEAHQFRSLLV